jgi:hypothetical protein
MALKGHFLISTQALLDRAIAAERRQKSKQLKKGKRRAKRWQTRLKLKMIKEKKL